MMTNIHRSKRLIVGGMPAMVAGILIAFWFRETWKSDKERVLLEEDAVWLARYSDRDIMSKRRLENICDLIAKEQGIDIDPADWAVVENGGDILLMRSAAHHGKYLVVGRDQSIRWISDTNGQKELRPAGGGR